jgi:cyclophilin family peptidyl-prolyl cis-trans isomerase
MDQDSRCQRSKRSQRLQRLLVSGPAVVALSIACGSGEVQPSTTASSENKSTTDQQEARPKVESSAIQAIDEFIAAQNIDQSGSKWKTNLALPPKLTFDDGKTYYWELVTNVGNVSIKLLPDVAPMHVSSTLYLTRLGFFDGLTFHRVIPGFMAQGGDPLGNGRGSPGYRFAGEFDGSVRHDKPGLLSQANAGPGTDGSQFFLTFVATPHLDDKHTIYGEVVDGMETVKELERWRERGSPHMADPLLIEKAEIRID